MYNIYIYGIGHHTEELLEYIDTKRVNILGFIETNRSQAVYCGKQVVEVKRIPELSYDYILVGSWIYEEEMTEKLMRGGYAGKISSQAD